MSKRGRGRPRLTEGEMPVSVTVRLPAAVVAAIDKTGTKRSEFIRQAAADALQRISQTLTE